MENLHKTLTQKPFIMAGPCIIEGEEMVLDLAKELKAIVESLGFTYIFKASFDKANRTSVEGYRGGGMESGLKILQKVRDTFGVPVVTDIHESTQAEIVAKHVDILQIPAFLCRQTDLLLAAGKTGKVINIKKAQFLSGVEMQFALKKVESTGNKNILLCERGTMFGYNNLVVDYRNLVDMKQFGYPVVMDVTHSTQKPGGLGGASGGNSEYAPYLAAAAAAVGVKGFFFEVHRDPDKALSDGPNMIKLSDFKNLLEENVVPFLRK
jgi:2-dehydro-3-deoxyphosphooctonate aldolase (KDO 8-P synthase)